MGGDRARPDLRSPPLPPMMEITCSWPLVFSLPSDPRTPTLLPTRLQKNTLCHKAPKAAGVASYADLSRTCSSRRLRPTVVPMVLITPGLGRAMCPGTEARPGRGL